jgi:hypothetical protein
MQIRERIITFIALLLTIGLILACVVGYQWFQTLSRDLQIVTAYAIPGLLAVVIIGALVLGIFALGVRIGISARGKPPNVHYHGATPQLTTQNPQPTALPWWAARPQRAFDVQPTTPGTDIQEL